MSRLHQDLWLLGVRELATMVRDREISPLEVMDAALERIGSRNHSINALVYLDLDGARADAEAATDAIQAGARPGPLFGVPTAIKDLFDFKPGWPSTFGGIPALRNFEVDGYCGFARRVEGAGAIIVGKGNAPVLGFRGTTDNDLFGPSRNPFDPGRNAGGSSGGCAAAVADGLLSFAEGTDGGGSIRIPAAWCGIVGLKPSYGRIPFHTRPNAFAAVTPFAFEGPLTRSVEDAAFVLSAVAGADPRDPLSIPGRTDFLAALERGVDGMRIAYTPDYDGFPIDHRIAAVVAQAVEDLEGAGAEIEELEFGFERDHRELADVWMRLTSVGMAETAAVLRSRGFDLLGEHSSGIPSRVLDLIEFGYARTTVGTAEDQVVRTQVLDRFEDALERFDAIVGPTVAAMPVENGDHGCTVGPAHVEGVEVDELIGWCPTFLVNFTGHPAASIPAGVVDGLPVGLQVIGRRWADRDVIAIGAELERVRPWADSYRIPQQRSLN
jgi:amidase/aspartyl-tRNA(Asn)/glutamyl-tRNA(Gln) amidotransferase subunit A